MAEREYQGGQVSRMNPGFTRPGVGGVRSGIPQVSPTGPRQPLVEAQATPQPLDVRSIERALGNWVQIQTRQNQARRADEAEQLALQRQAEMGSAGRADTPENFTNQQKVVFEKTARDAYLQAFDNDSLGVVSELSLQYQDDPDGFTNAASAWLDSALEGMEEQDIRLFTAAREKAEFRIAQRTGAIAERAFKKRTLEVAEAQQTEHKKLVTTFQTDLLRNPNEETLVEAFASTSESLAIVTQDMSPADADQLMVQTNDALMGTYVDARVRQFTDNGNFDALRGLAERMRSGRFSAAGNTFMDPVAAAEAGDRLLQQVERAQGERDKQLVAQARVEVALLEMGQGDGNTPTLDELENTNPQEHAKIVAESDVRQFVDVVGSATPDDITAKTEEIAENVRVGNVSPDLGLRAIDALQKTERERRDMAMASGPDQMNYCAKNGLRRSKCAVALEVSPEELPRYAAIEVEQALTSTETGEITPDSLGRAMAATEDGVPHMLDFVAALDASGLPAYQKAAATAAAHAASSGLPELADTIVSLSSVAGTDFSDTEQMTDLLKGTGINEADLNETLQMLSGHDPRAFGLMSQGFARLLQGAEATGRASFIEQLNQIPQVDVLDKPYPMSMFKRGEEPASIIQQRLADFEGQLENTLRAESLDGRDVYLTPIGNDRVQVYVGERLITSPDGALDWTISDYTSQGAQQAIEDFQAEQTARDAAADVVANTVLPDATIGQREQSLAVADEINRVADSANVPRSSMYQMLLADKAPGSDIMALEGHIDAATNRATELQPAGGGKFKRSVRAPAPPSLMYSDGTNTTYSDYANWIKAATDRLGDPEKVFAARIMGVDWVEDTENRVGDNWMMALPEEVADYVDAAMGATVDETNLPPKIMQSSQVMREGGVRGYSQYTTDIFTRQEEFSE